MTEENKETQQISYKGDIKTQPQFGVSIMRDRSILLADDVKVLIDGSTKLGTFLFFRKQIIPSKGNAERTIQLGGINHELLLEVKVPFTTILPFTSVFEISRICVEKWSPLYQLDSHRK